MELNDFDTQLKQKLEDRRIVPSDSSWGKLSFELDKKSKRSKNIYRWLAIAAVFLIGLFMGAKLFKPNSTIQINQVVKSSAIGLEKETSEKSILNEKPLPVSNSIVLGEAQRQSSINKTPENHQDKIQLASKIIKKNHVEKVLNRESTVLIPNIEKRSPLTEIAETNLTKVEEEAEKLLQQAQVELQNNPFRIRPTNQVNVQALLESIEVNANGSTKERVFKLLQDKLLQLASANRLLGK